MVILVDDQPPPGWVDVQVAPPPIAESSGAVITMWRARRSPDDSAVLVSGCVATPIPGWVEDMAPAVEARTTAFTGASAERITGYPIDASRTNAGGGGGSNTNKLVLRPASNVSGPPIGVARTFIGFDESRVLTCFATCVMRRAEQPPGVPTPCEAGVMNARLDGSTSPPGPSIALRSATWAVHHPRPTAFVAGIVIALTGVLSIVLRRRPRSAA